MIYKYKDIETNINNKTVDIGNVGVRFYTEDENTGSIRIFIKWNGKNVDLDSINMRPKLDLFLSDGSIFIDEAINIISSKSGLIQYNIPNKVIKHAGVVNAKLFLESELESVHVANFSFNIVDSGVEDKVQKEISLNLVEDTVKRIMSDDLTELLDNGFKTELTTDLQNYISENSEQFKGPQGERGLQGEQGIQGNRGETGAQGPKGEKGDTGAQGVQGIKGDKGDTGQIGIKGDTGPKGEKGDKGNPFVYSDFTQSQLAGLKGPKGDTGPQGVKGDIGPQGVKGDTGVQGPKGEPGTNATLPDTSNWQKYKLTNDDGTNFYDSGLKIDFSNSEQLASLTTGARYIVGGIKTPATATSSNGWLIKLSRGVTQHLEFRPYNSSQRFVKRFYNTWSDWEEITTPINDTGWVSLSLQNGAKAFTFSSSYMSPSYRVITIGTKKIVKLYGEFNNLTSGQIITSLPSEFTPNNIMEVKFIQRRGNDTVLGYISPGGDVKIVGSTQSTEYILNANWLV